MPEKPPENTIEHNALPQSPESEFSPEVLERVMAKVQDIGKDGTAFTVVTEDRNSDHKDISNVLENGLLGWPTEWPKERSKEEWAGLARKTKESLNHFNIVGHTIPEVEKEFALTKVSRHIENSEWVSRAQSKANAKRNSAVFLFDIQKFNYEGPEQIDERGYRKHHKRGKYYRRGQINTWRSDDVPEQIKTGPYGETGFVMRDRIAPRLFIGTIPLGKMDENELQKRMAETKDFLPIYDIKGNLLWPQKMTYEEVKKFVEERDKNKEKK